jgi:branched-chain amino acid transport system permease protein
MMMPRGRTGWAAAIAVLIVVIGLPQLLRPYGIYLLTMWAVLSIAAIGLNLTLGFAGQISLAQASFVGVGAYTSALLTTQGWPLGVAILLAAVLAFAIGWLLGYPALRVQGHYLAFVTLAFTTLAFLVFRNEEWLTGGIYGINRIPRPVLFGWPTKDPALFYYLCLAVLAVAMLALAKVLRSPWGRAFAALRENPARALSLGIDTRTYTLLAFAIGAGLGGVSGALYAPLVQFVDPASFSLTLSFNLLLMVVVGGIGSFYGPLVGTLVAVLLPEWLRFTDGVYLILYAGCVMLLMVFCPTGILGFVERARQRFGNRREPGISVVNSDFRS